VRDNGDVQRLGLVLVWVIATVAVTVLAWRVVLAADARVSERPITQVVAVPSTAARPTISVPEQTTTSLDLDPDAPTRSSTTIGGEDTSTTADSLTTSTATAPSTASTQTTSTGVGYSVKTIPSEGGSVTVRYRPGEVDLVAVVPVTGWAWDLKKQSADDIEGEFRRDGLSITVRARWVDGEFRTDVES
jgi:hypothetical protein